MGGNNAAGGAANLNRVVVIVGAGVAGLQAARAIAKRGSIAEVVLLEQTSSLSVGASFKGLALQVPWHDVQIPEYPLPHSIIPSGPYPTKDEMSQYLQSYAEDMDLLQYIQFNCRLVNLAPSRAGWAVTYMNSQDKQQTTLFASFVVVTTGTSTAPQMPQYPGLVDFNGAVLHASEVKDLSLSSGKHVVLVGNGRSPADLVVECAAAQNAASVSLVNRKVRWPMLNRGRNAQWLLHSRLGCSLGQSKPYYTATTAQKIMKAVMKPLKAALWMGIKRKLKEVRHHAEEYDLTMEVPETDLHWGGHLDEDLWRTCVESGKIVALEGRIRFLKPDAIVLDTGVELNTDLIIMCTGFASCLRFLDPRVTLKLQLEEDGLFLWRHMIHPEVKNLAFLGCTVTTSSHVLTTALQAEWLAAALSGQVDIPGNAEMFADIKAQRRWRRRVIKPQGIRAGLLMPYTQEYHDQLLADMNLNPRRKGFNIFKECFSPITAADYAVIVGYTGDMSRFHPDVCIYEHHHQPVTPGGMSAAAHMCTDYSIRQGQGRLAYYKDKAEVLVNTVNHPPQHTLAWRSIGGASHIPTPDNSVHVPELYLSHANSRAEFRSVAELPDQEHEEAIALQQEQAEGLYAITPEHSSIAYAASPITTTTRGNSAHGAIMSNTILHDMTDAVSKASGRRQSMPLPTKRASLSRFAGLSDSQNGYAMDNPSNDAMETIGTSTLDVIIATPANPGLSPSSPTCDSTMQRAKSSPYRIDDANLDIADGVDDADQEGNDDVLSVPHPVESHIKGLPAHLAQPPKVEMHRSASTVVDGSATHKQVRRDSGFQRFSEASAITHKPATRQKRLSSACDSSSFVAGSADSAASSFKSGGFTLKGSGMDSPVAALHRRAAGSADTSKALELLAAPPSCISSKTKRAADLRMRQHLGSRAEDNASSCCSDTVNPKAPSLLDYYIQSTSGVISAMDQRRISSLPMKFPGKETLEHHDPFHDVLWSAQPQDVRPANDSGGGAYSMSSGFDLDQLSAERLVMASPSGTSKACTRRPTSSFASYDGPVKDRPSSPRGMDSKQFSLSTYAAVQMASHTSPGVIFSQPASQESLSRQATRNQMLQGTPAPVSPFASSTTAHPDMGSADGMMDTIMINEDDRDAGSTRTGTMHGGVHGIFQGLMSIPGHHPTTAMQAQQVFRDILAQGLSAVNLQLSSGTMLPYRVTASGAHQDGWMPSRGTSSGELHSRSGPFHVHPESHKTSKSKLMNLIKRPGHHKIHEHRV